MDPFDAVSKLAGMASNIYPKIHDSVEDWNNPASVSNEISKVSEQVVEFLNRVPGMIQAHSRDFKRAMPIFKLRDGSVVKAWKNPVGVNHVENLLPSLLQASCAPGQVFLSTIPTTIHLR
ncbi:hypothetical protein RIF25_04725 [Thermosynechococcaceae cyanobacterium BACA0444]|uniref:Uncharacterized protein n=1 Tax=Pseudocalidococcus azoricus BACA0444 TaxID=2918990 RepID=A0AAE4FQ54_9CYAN|nr:hypothetical protein [Pseudocalidococcus azoricus]MDS3860105.1 hypothetical protein [Pseudocalidococcus azoricus BACA0444]